MSTTQPAVATDARGAPREHVVLVPGAVGFAGAEMLPLAGALRRSGYRVSVFWHRTGLFALEESARALWRRVSRIDGDVVHFVGHSVGGLIVLRMLADHAWERPGRLVTLATPHGGLTAARRLAQLPGGRRLLGPGVHAAAIGSPIEVAPHRELGVVAGDRNVIFGWWLLPKEPNDSLVGVEETRHPAGRAHLIVHETHATLLYAPRVARQVEEFLRYGRFPEIPRPSRH